MEGSGFGTDRGGNEVILLPEPGSFNFSQLMKDLDALRSNNNNKTGSETGSTIGQVDMEDLGKESVLPLESTDGVSTDPPRTEDADGDRVSSDNEQLELAGLLPEPDFLLPGSIKIGSVGDAGAKENSKLYCVAGEVKTPSEFYLTFAADDNNKFIMEMSEAYHKRFRYRRYRHGLMLELKDKLIQPGGIVACFHSVGSRQRKDLVRAKIIRDVSDEMEKKYDVFLLDLAQTKKEVPVYEMFFLHRDFVWRSAGAIKCRLHLGPYYDVYHDGIQEWSTSTCNLLTDVLKGRRLTVHFIRQVQQENGGRIWYVSIPALLPGHRSIRDGKLVEEEIIKKSTGNYVR